MRTVTHAVRPSVLSLVLLAACGGGGDAGPGPLAHHFDDMHIAAIPLEEKSQVIQAQNDYSVAKMERAKAEADYNESGTQIEIAKNERAQTLLAEKSALSKKKAAEDSNDLNRINASAAEMRATELSRKAADQKVTWVNAQRAYLKKQLRYAEENMYAQEAKFEMAKARLAHGKNIRPKGFDFPAYEKQYKARSERAQRAKAVASKEKQKSDDKKKAWQATDSAAKRASGAPAEGDNASGSGS